MNNAALPDEGTYRQALENAKQRAQSLGGERGAAIDNVVSRSARRQGSHGCKAIRAIRTGGVKRPVVWTSDLGL
jgi:hypothetical protein